MNVTPTSCKIFGVASDAHGVIRWWCVTPIPTPLPVNYGHLIMSVLPKDPTFPKMLFVTQVLPYILFLIPIICFSVVGFILFFRLKYFRKFITGESVLLEIIPPADAKQSALSTEELFTKLHGLSSQGSRLEGFIGNKKTFSLEIVSTKEKGIRYVIRTNPLDAKVVKDMVISYLPNAKVHTIDDYIPQKIQELSSKSWNIYDLHLTNHFSLPLKNQTTLSQHDPMASITGSMTKLNSNEMIILQYIITPVLEETHKRLTKKLAAIEYDIYHGLDISERLVSKTNNIIFGLIGKLILLYIKIWLFCVITPFTLVFSIFTQGAISPIPLWLFFNKTARVEELSEQQKYIQKMVGDKIVGELFETTIRLYIVQKKSKDFNGRIKSFIAAFSAFNSDYFQRFSFHSPFQYMYILKQWAFYKLKYRLLSITGNPILSISELAALFHFPYMTTTKTENIVKVYSPELPAPLSLKQEKDLDVTFGINTYGNETTVIGLTDDERSRHMYLLGQTGSGKSTVMFNMAKDDIQRGHGVALVDPHGDLVEDLLSTVPETRIDDFIYLNPFDLKHPIGINLLELASSLDEDEIEIEKQMVVDGIISIFRRVFSDEEQTNAHRIEHILRNAIYTAFYVKDATLFTVNKLLINKKFREAAIKLVDDENLLDFWKEEFGRAGDWQVFKMVEGVTAKVETFLFSPAAKRILEQPKSTINFDDIVEKKKILLCNVSEGKLGENTSRLIGTTIITKIQQVIYRRARKEKQSRTPFYLFIDEFQNFATSSFTKLLSGGRKYGTRVTIAQQTTSQQKDDKITNQILANNGTIVCFKTASPIDEDLLIPQFSPYIEKGNIMNLPRYHFYMKLGAIEPEEPFSGETLPVTTKTNNELINKLIEASRKNYAITYVKKDPIIKEDHKKENSNSKPKVRSGAPA